MSITICQRFNNFPRKAVQSALTDLTVLRRFSCDKLQFYEEPPLKHWRVHLIKNKTRIVFYPLKYVDIWSLHTKLKIKTLTDSISVMTAMNSFGSFYPDSNNYSTWSVSIVVEERYRSCTKETIYKLQTAARWQSLIQIHAQWTAP